MSEIQRPVCPQCGGQSITFREIFGPVPQNERLNQMQGRLESAELQLQRTLEHLDRQLQRRADQLQQETDRQLQQLQSQEGDELRNWREDAKRAVEEDQEGILRYLIVDEALGESPDPKVLQIKGSYEAKRQNLLRESQQQRQELDAEIGAEKDKAVADVASEQTRFAQETLTNTLAIVYCDNCGHVLGTSHSPRIVHALMDHHRGQLQHAMAMLGETLAQQFASLASAVVRIEEQVGRTNEQLIESTIALRESLAKIASLLRTYDD